jgi:hypothetical protein
MHKKIQHVDANPKKRVVRVGLQQPVRRSKKSR